MDYYRITHAFINRTAKNPNGFVEPKQFLYDAKINTLTNDLIKIFLNIDAERVVWYDRLLKSKLFSRTDRKPRDNEIINLGNPYILKN